MSPVAVIDALASYLLRGGARLRAVMVLKTAATTSDLIRRPWAFVDNAAAFCGAVARRTRAGRHSSDRAACRGSSTAAMVAHATVMYTRNATRRGLRRELGAGKFPELLVLSGEEA